MVSSEQTSLVIGEGNAILRRRPTTSVLTILVLVALLIAGVAGLFVTRRIAPTSAAGIGATAPIVIMAIDAGCGPREVHVAAPGNLPITFHNHGLVAHTFTIDSVGGQLTAEPRGDIVEGIFNLSKPGRYTFRCGGPNQPTTAMSGTLIVGNATKVDR